MKNSNLSSIPLFAVKQLTEGGDTGNPENVISQIYDIELVESMSADSDILKGKKILDVTCGPRGIWFNPHEPHTLYCDQRSEHNESYYDAHRTIDVSPDVVCDFTRLPFPDNTFHLVVFDPPHLIGQDKSWLKKRFGYYSSKESAIDSINSGISECMRVLKPYGVLIFKWCELQISTRDIIDSLDYKPLFGHRSGKKSNTHWMTFMKF